MDRINPARFIASLIVLLSLTACGQDEWDDETIATQEIKLCATLEPQTQTRATSQSHLADATHFAANQKIALFISGGTVYTGDLHTMTTGSDGKLIFDTGHSCYWISEAVNFYAWYPFVAGGPFAGKKSSDATIFTVKADQSSAADYAASDLMCAKSTNVEKPADVTNSHLLTFTHALSQVIVVLKSSEATKQQITAEQLATAQVTINGTESAPLYLSANVDIDEASAPYSADASTTSLRLGTGATTYAVIPSGQSLTGKVIRFKLDGVEDKTYTISSIGTLAAGKKYTITLTLTLNTFTATETVEDWTEGESRDKTSSPLYV